MAGRVSMSHPRWFAPFLVLALVAQALLTAYYYRSGAIGSAVAGLLCLCLLVLALWGLKCR